MKVNERRTVVGVDWPLDWPSISLHGWGGHTCVPPTVERDRRACVPVCLTMQNVTVLYGRRAASHRHVFPMMAVVNSPATVFTFSYRCLVADTLYVVQPNRPAACSITVSNHRTFGPKRNDKIYMEYYRHGTAKYL